MKTFMFAFALLATILLAGCAATQQAKSVQTDGFLAPYKDFLEQDHSGKKALLHYMNPDADWAGYRKIELLPVLLWNDPKSDLSAEQKRQLQAVVDDFYSILYKKLSGNYTMVQSPGPGVLQVQVAISHGEPSLAGLSFASKIVRPARLANTLYSKASGKPAFTGGVTIEVVVKDADSGTLLAAAADRRVGGMKIFEKNAFNSWGDVRNCLEFYAVAMTWRLCKVSGGSHCVKPEA